MVISLGVVALLGALGVGITSGWVQREMTRNELAAVSAAEQVRSPDTPYISCAVHHPITNNYFVGLSAEVVEVRFLQRELDDLPGTLDIDNPSHFAVSCPQEEVPPVNPGDPPTFIDVDFGLQAIFLRASEGGGDQEALISIVKGDR